LDSELARSQSQQNNIQNLPATSVSDDSSQLQADDVYAHQLSKAQLQSQESLLNLSNNLSNILFNFNPEQEQEVLQNLQRIQETQEKEKIASKQQSAADYKNQ
jgi:hypothetical protein